MTMTYLIAYFTQRNELEFLEILEDVELDEDFILDKPA